MQNAVLFKLTVAVLTLMIVLSFYSEGSAMQQNRVRDYVIFTILPRLHQDYARITPRLHQDYTWFLRIDY